VLFLLQQLRYKSSSEIIAMRKVVSFSLNFAIGFLLLTICSLGFLLISHAPMPIGGSIARVGIESGSSTVYIPGYKFACTPNGQIAQCEVNFQNKPLKIVLVYTNNERKWEVSQCQFNYAGLTENCTTNFDSIILGGWLPYVSIKSNLGLSPQQLQDFQRQEAQNSNIVTKLSEDELGMLSTGLAIAIGFVIAAFSWLHFSRFVKALAISLIGLIIFRISLNWLDSISFITAQNYGLSPDQLIQLVMWMSIGSGIVTIIIAAYLLWSRSNQFVKGFVTFINGLGMFALSWFLFLFSLLTLGYAD
jgi:hypothetical protein